MPKPLESRFQAKVIKKIKTLWPEAIVTKLDSGHIQGIPDLLILAGKKWATLESKRYEGASRRPNQDWYVDKMNRMSFSRFISPENMEEVFGELKAFLDDL